MSLLLNSCFNDDLNQDPHTLYKANPNNLISYAQKSLSDYTNTSNVNRNNFRLIMQYWQESQYIEESRYDFANRDVADNIWSISYASVLNNLKEAKRIIESTQSSEENWEQKKKSQSAIIELLQVYTFQTLVDTFGDIPYFQALDTNIPLPKYDKGEDIYKDLIGRAKKAVTDLNSLPTTIKAFDNGDLLYDGNIVKWKKFGNSLLLKLGLGIADHNPNLAKQTVEHAIQAGGDGIINSADDNCQLTYTKSFPNPLYEAEVLSKRKDFIAGKTLIDFMNSESDASKHDPRIDKYYTKVEVNKIENGEVVTDSEGNPIKVKKYIGQTIGKKGKTVDFSGLGDFVRTYDHPGTILSHTEVAFYIAEATARGWITSKPANVAYEDAIRASFGEWGISDATANNYISAYPFNAADWEKDLGHQAWVAMYNQGLVSWNFYRRLGYPKLQAASGAIGAAEGKVPVRLMYPSKEHSVNGTNWSEASDRIGGDKLTTKIFWDKDD